MIGDAMKKDRLKLFRISIMAKNEKHVAYIAQPFLEKLMEKTGETSNLIVLSGEEAVYVAQSESRKLIKMFTKIGARVPLYCAGAGKVLLAYQPSKKQNLIAKKLQFKSYTKNTITDPVKLLEECTSIREKGYAVDNEEREEGVTCIAAPIFDYSGEVIAV
jgi:IclR family acetate operon transcriptional repressor